ncbi:MULTISPECIES: ThiF family adenylyltransferase [unclassified Mesorhizobium]|uniref:ThiF family adenylyltransferase n=1 Tax=unclassified Mesorhizobium TaxID=325217 RepID=UPI001093A6A9|nr:ThiF family adenylyltransferase [Mesorhizobium sp. M8A.F.Ca.ET.161.01.1.1]TGV43454.1 ThiF family adenylyltransferase [Mesorhizobium sp. M8A.F.Ca.ET.142.01.1.1]
MSRRLIALSPDLLRMQNEGYDLEIRGGYLLVRNVPYVDTSGTVRLGILISKLELSGDKTVKPTDHVAYWTGEHPCHSDGSKITAIQNSSAPQDFGDGVKADHTFSAKADYRDYHHKMTTYIGRIAGEAAKVDPLATARTYPAIPADDKSCVYKYVDTATSRAGIGAVNAKVAGQKVGILGMGGTGAYVFDLVTKTAAAQIHIFDGDVFSQHNAFRAPGAPSLEDLEIKPQKVTYFADLYSNMHKGIVPHDVYLDETNVALLDGLDFVFICIDRGPVKRVVIDRLIANGTPFAEVGMGVVIHEGQLGGIVRLTTSTPDTREAAAPHISYADDDGGANEYATNIQIAELNSLNAVIAVMAWKQHFGIYRQSRPHFYTGYSIGSGEFVHESAA